MNEFYQDKNTKQRGNALFIILVAIVVFSVLTYTVSNMLQSGISGNVVGEEKAESTYIAKCACFFVP